VNLSWDPSTSVVAGYEVYRSVTAGGPYTKINSELHLSTTYVDNSVDNGKTYFYVTTAVDDSGSESIHSNEVRAAIPSL
jgi:fibronectin type 3 domain-containing protein